MDDLQMKRWKQIEELYNRLKASASEHAERAVLKERIFFILGWIQTGLLTATVGTLVALLVCGIPVLAVVSAGLAMVSLMLTIYLQRTAMSAEAYRHRKFSASVSAREMEVESILTDGLSMPPEVLEEKRDALIAWIRERYAEEPTVPSRKREF